MDRGKLDDSWTVHNGILFFKGTIFLQSTSPLIASILSGFHDDMHEGYQKTLQRVQSEFYWQGMHSTIADYVASCPIYQCNIYLNTCDQLDYFSLLHFRPKFGQTFPWISLMGSQNRGAKLFCLWWWIASLSMLIFFPLPTLYGY